MRFEMATLLGLSKCGSPRWPASVTFGIPFRGRGVAGDRRLLPTPTGVSRGGWHGCAALRVSRAVPALAVDAPGGCVRCVGFPT